ncbi:4Fe-4S dicluster domain-containing protein [Hominifimenecus sp. rT4P-3]|uniref:4Fe-4S dicluster domain-containing protein n=1 Tax=Hominifimenecus sp. rT4P-3 TaxID=3242979 RepID=UPI003DA30856
MAKIEVDTEKCKECGLCIAKCPKKLLKSADETNSMGYYYTIQEREEDCIGCGICYLFCPDAAITVRP